MYIYCKCIVYWLRCPAVIWQKYSKHDVKHHSINQASKQHCPKWHFLTVLIFPPQMQKHCNCEVRSFDVGHYPDHISVFANKAYQPILIQVTSSLDEFKYINDKLNSSSTFVLKPLQYVILLSFYQELTLNFLKIVLNVLTSNKKILIKIDLRIWINAFSFIFPHRISSKNLDLSFGSTQLSNWRTPET